MDVNQLTRIFCQVDDFCKEFHQYTKHNLLPSPSKQTRGPARAISNSEIMTILIFFQNSGFRNFKTFYKELLEKYWKDAFPKLPSYNRFVELTGSVIFPLVLFAQVNSGKRTGIYYIDSTCLPACHLKRSGRNKTFAEIAEHGYTSIGCFFGFKLHIVINNHGQLIAFKITRGNVNDAKASVSILEKLKGLAFGDKGYIGKELAAKLLKHGLKLITRVRKNMKPKKISSLEKQLLNQRGIIETVFNHLKHYYQVWHTRHRSLINAMTHLMAALCAYTIEPLKISAFKLLGGINLTT